MKKLLIFIPALFIVISALSQKLEKNSNGLYEYQKVLVYDSIPKDVLFSKSKEWIALNYRDGNSVIQNSDKEAGNIIVKGNFNTIDLGALIISPRVMHTFIIDVKDGKVRCTFTNFKFTCYNCGDAEYFFEGYQGSYASIINKKIEKIKEPTYIKCASITQSLSDYIKSSLMKKNEW